MQFFQKSLMFAGMASIVGFFNQTPTQAFELSFAFSDLAHPNLVHGELRLISGSNQYYSNVSDQGFDLDGISEDLISPSESDEYFDLFVDGTNVGRYGCYSSSGITNLNGIVDHGACAFDVTFSFFDDFGLDFLSLVSDGSLLIQALFTDDVAIAKGGNFLTTVLTTYYASPPVNVPTPTAVLPVLSGLLTMARHRKER